MGDSLAKKQQCNPRDSRERPCWTVRFRDSRQDGYAKTIWQKGRTVKQKAEKTELRQCNLTFDPPIQLSKARRDAIGHEDVDFKPGIVQQGGEFGIRELLEAG